MSGFEIFLLVIACIILLIITILSIPVKVSIGYDDKIHLAVKYLFIKLDILPSSPKEKKEKPPKEKKAKPEEEKKEEAPKEKKSNPIVDMVKANGSEGMYEVIRNLGAVLKLYSGKLFKSVVFDSIVLHTIVGTGDAASTAIKYGETCQKVFPVMGFICSNNLVKKYDILVEPDFLANKTESEFYCDISITIRKIINATIGLVVRLVFKVLLKFISGAKRNKNENQTANEETMKG